MVSTPVQTAQAASNVTSQLAGVGNVARTTTHSTGKTAAHLPNELQNNVPPLKERHHLYDDVEFQVLNEGDSIGWGFFNLEFFGPLLAGLLGATVGKLPWVGKYFRVGTDSLLRAPTEAMKATKLGQVGALPANLVGAVADVNTKHLGSSSLYNVADNIRPVEKAVAEKTLHTGEASPLWQRWQRSGLAKHHKNLLSDVDTLMQNVKDPHNGFLNKITRRAGRLFGKAGTEVVKTPAYMHEIEGHLGKFRAALGSTHGVADMTTAKAHLADAQAALKVLPKGAEVTSHAAKLAEHFRHVEEGTHGLAGRMDAAAGRRTMMSALKSAAANTTVFDAGFKGGMLAGAAYQTGRTTLRFTESISYLKELHKDLTGKDASTYTILFGKLPKMVEQARSNMWANLGPEAIGAAGNSALNILFTMRHHNPLLMGGAIMMQMAHWESSKLGSEGNFLNSYVQVKDAQKDGTFVPLDYYAQIIMAASPKAAGATGGIENPLLQQLAKEYAEEQIPVAELLAEIDGEEKFNERTERIAEELGMKQKEQAEANAKAFREDKAKELEQKVKERKEAPVKAEERRQSLRERAAKLNIPPTTLMTDSAVHEGAVAVAPQMSIAGEESANG